MKRLITFALVLVMALSLAAPAMAFTGVAAPEASGEKPELAIKLVDISEGYVTVNFNAPPTNRGYVTNEVVCAVVALQVPKGYDFVTDVDVLQFSGVNVSLWQDENFYGDGGDANGGGVGTLKYMSANANNALRGRNEFAYALNMAADNWIQLNGLEELDDVHKGAAQTYHFAIFGRVLGENAKMTATLRTTRTLPNVYGGGVQTASPIDSDDAFIFVPIHDDDYSVAYFTPFASKTTNNSTDLVTRFATSTLGANVTSSQILMADDEILYVVQLEDNFGILGDDALFAIVTDRNHNCEKMYVATSTSTGGWHRVYDGNKREDAIQANFWGGTYIQFQREAFTTAGSKTTVLATGTDAATYMFILEKIVNDEFGFDIRNMGNRLEPTWWFDNTSQTVEVAIEPWYAEVTVPPEIEIDIPKTGDAMSAVGFVLIALAGLAVVAVRKVRA